MKIGVRGSNLALAYANRVCNELPCDTEIVVVIRSSTYFDIVTFWAQSI